MSRLFVASEQDYVEIQETPVTAVPLTLACWAKPVTIAATQSLLGVFDSGSTTNYYILRLTAGPAAFAAVSLPSVAAVHGTTPSTGAWQHFCGVFASTTSAKAYLNGASPVEDTTLQTATSIDRASIGRAARSSPTAYADAYIAHCAIWNTALTDGEVAQLAAGALPTAVQAGNLVSYVPLTSNTSPEPDSVWA